MLIFREEGGVQVYFEDLRVVLTFQWSESANDIGVIGYDDSNWEKPSQEGKLAKYLDINI